MKSGTILAVVVLVPLIVCTAGQSDSLETEAERIHREAIVIDGYVGIGSDFDGALMPEGMEDCSKLPQITEELLRRGYSEPDIKKILGGNILRVMEDVAAASARLKQS